MAPNYSFEQLVNAVYDVTDNGISVRGAASRNGVPHTTLSDQLQAKHTNRFEATKAAQRLSKEQEEGIVRWITRQEALGYAPTASTVKCVVNSLLSRLGKKKPLGKHWIERFKERHPEISTKIGRRQEAARFKAFTPKAVN